jgi:hypothetical protein
LAYLECIEEYIFSEIGENKIDFNMSSKAGWNVEKTSLDVLKILKTSANVQEA